MSQDRGVIYLDIIRRGTSTVLAVAIYTLRKHWAEPVTIYVDEVTRELAERIAAAAGGVEIVTLKPEHRAYAVKPQLPALSPYRFTAQIDADTMVVAPIDDLFPTRPNEFRVTSFGGWVSTGPRMSGRIEEWAMVSPERVRRQLSRPWPAINTGVVAYGNESTVARIHWLEETLKRPKSFMADELAAQNLLGEYQDEIVILDDRWNCSPRFGAHKEDAKVLHFHGHGKIGRLPEYITLWWPVFTELWRQDWAGIREWFSSAANRHIIEYAYTNPRVMGEVA